MNLQNYLLCALYILLIIAHSFTLCQRDFHMKLISIFSFALFTQTISTVLFTIHQAILSYGPQYFDLKDADLSSINNIQYIVHLLYLISINFFILFLLIIAKGWPITRRDMPFKYAFAVFWLMCLTADLLTFYWSTLTLLAENFTNKYYNINTNTIVPVTNNSSSMQATITTILPLLVESTTKPPSTILDSLTGDTEQFNSTPKRLSLVLRIVIMIYFLLELRTTMILEQEQKKLQFYLHFGAFSMVWFVHSLIVYVISLRVEVVWQSKLISGFSSAANFLAFAITAKLLWPRSSKSYLFRKRANHPADELAENGEMSLASEDDDSFDGLEMKDLSGNKYSANDNNNNNNSNGNNNFSDNRKAMIKKEVLTNIQMKPDGEHQGSSDEEHEKST